MGHNAQAKEKGGGRVEMRGVVGGREGGGETDGWVGGGGGS